MTSNINQDDKKKKKKLSTCTTGAITRLIQFLKNSQKNTTAK